MFTKFSKNKEKLFILILGFLFLTALSILLYVDNTKAQSLPRPPINENEVEDLNLFRGTTIGGNSNLLLYIDYSQSMGTNPAGVQTGNWDQSYTVDDDTVSNCDGFASDGDNSVCIAGTCALRQKIDNVSSGDPEGFAIAHCAANAAGITTELVDKDGGVIHNAYLLNSGDTITITSTDLRPDTTIMRTTDGIVERFNSGIAFEGVFGGCGSRACNRSKFGTCEDPVDFGEFINCIDIAYSDVLCPTCPTTSDETIVISVLANAADVNCGDSTTVSTILGSGLGDTDIVTSLKSTLNTGCMTDRERIWAAAAMDNYSNFLWAETKTMPSDYKTCGAQHCITLQGSGFGTEGSPNLINQVNPSGTLEDHSCNNNTALGIGSGAMEVTTHEVDRFIACMETATQKQPFVKSCTSGGTDGDFCSPGQNGSTRADAMMTVLAQVLDRDNSIKNSTCTDTPRLFNGTTSPISCFNYLNTPFRDLGDIPDITGGGSMPVVTGDAKIGDQLDSADEALAPFRVNIGNYAGIDECDDNNSFNTDQGGGAGMSNEKFNNVFGELGNRRPSGRTPLASAIGLDDTNPENTGTKNDVLGIYRVTLNSDKENAACKAHFSVFITDGEDNCSGDCNSNQAFGTTGTGMDMDAGGDSSSGTCDNTLAPATGNSNRRSTLQAASFSRTHFARKPVQGNEFNTEVMSFFIGWGVKDNPQAVRTLNAAALLGGTHTTGLLLHRHPQGFISGQKDLDGSPGVPAVLPKADITEIRSSFPWVLEMAEMEHSGGDFSNNPLGVTLSGCQTPNETGSCSWNGTDVFDNDFFTGTAGTDLPTAFTRTNVGQSFAFFVDNPAELIAALEAIFDFTKGFSAVGQAPQVPPSVTAIGLRDRVLLPSFTPTIGEPIWQGRLALFGFLDDPDNPGTKIIVRKPRSDGEFLDGNSLDPEALRSANIFTDTGALSSNAEEFFWDAGKLLAERDIVSSATSRNLLTVGDSTSFGTLQIDNTGSGEFDAIIYTSGIVAFSRALDPEVFGISDLDVDPAGVESVISICSDIAADASSDGCGGVGVCDTSPPTPLTSACKTCIKEKCLRNKIVDFMTGHTGLLPVRDNFGEPTLESCSSNILDNTTRGAIGCGCPDLEVTNTNVVTDASLISSLAQCERRLGDIFNSQAKIVQAPSLLFFDTGFPVFAQTLRDRSAVIYAGANDGFLHAFHGGEFIDVINDGTLSAADKKNPFTGITETLPFVDEGTGNEFFGFAPPTFLTDSIAPDGTSDTDFDGVTDITRTIFPGVLPLNYDPTTPISLQDSTLITSSTEPLPDFRFGDFKTLVEKNLALGHLGANLLNDQRNFQRSFFDGTPFIIDVFLDGQSDQTNGLPYCKDPSVIADPYDSGPHPDGIIDDCGREWHTVLVSGFRNGGGGFTALDITNVKCADADCTAPTKRFANGPDYPEHLWTIFDRDMGNSWSQPKVGRVRIKYEPDGFTTDRWVLFAGGGLEPVFTNPTGDDDHPDTPANEAMNGLLNYEEPTYKGDSFYAIDVATGEIIFKFNENDNSNFVCDTPGDPNVVDINSDGYIDLVYLGDKCGRMWRFDVSEPIEAGITIAQDTGIKSTALEFSAPDWTGEPVFCANDPDAEDPPGTAINTCLSMTDDLRNPVASDTLFPIYFAPTTVLDNLGRRHVIFQTGDRGWPSNENTFGYLYNFIDEYIPSFQRGSGASTIDTFKTVNDIIGDGSTIGTILTISGGPDTFSINGPSSNINSGEFLVKYANGCNTSLAGCTEGGEIGIGTPIVVSGLLLFTTFVPQSGEVEECSAGLGSGRIFGIDFITGAAALSRVPGAEALVGGDGSIAGVEGGEGMPTPPSLSYSNNTITMSLAFSGSGVVGGAQFLLWELFQFPAATQTLYWEEVI